MFWNWFWNLFGIFWNMFWAYFDVKFWLLTCSICYGFWFLVLVCWCLVGNFDVICKFYFRIMGEESWSFGYPSDSYGSHFPQYMCYIMWEDLPMSTLGVWLLPSVMSVSVLFKTFSDLTCKHLAYVVFDMFWVADGWHLESPTK